MSNIPRLLIGALFLFSGYMVYFALVAQPPSTEKFPIIDEKLPLPLPGNNLTPRGKMEIPTGDLPQGAARKLQKLLNDLPSSKTKIELKERNVAISKHREILIEDGDKSLDAIKTLINDKRQIVRAKAIGMLRPIGTPEAVKVLAAASASGEKATRLYALQEIESLLPSKQLPQQSIKKLTVPSLLISMADNNEEIRISAARACWRVTQKRFDYDAKASKELRNKALAEFYKWWKIETTQVK